MSEEKAFLEKVHIKNFLSLRDVELPLKPLTVLVGPNASGKSNILNALDLLNTVMTAEELPPVEFTQNRLWAGEANHISFQLHAKVEEIPALYELKLKADANNPFVAEELLINSVKVISIQSGQGTVRDEDGENETQYRSNKLALKSAGDYGNKPITSTLTGFIKDWEFYDFRPEYMRNHLETFPFIIEKLRESPKLDDGSKLPALLSYWHKNTPERFHSVSDSLADSTNLRMDQRSIDGDTLLCLSEGYEKPIPLKRASDGTLRLVAYYILLNEPELPPLIAIEEPERNLHPGALRDIANVIEQISEHSQVIITTHSSQLLDAFNPENLSDSLGVLLLRNIPGQGTEVINLEDIRGDRVALDGWIQDFGIGSAIFDSGLLQDLMEEPGRNNSLRELGTVLAKFQ